MEKKIIFIVIPLLSVLILSGCVSSSREGFEKGLDKGINKESSPQAIQTPIVSFFPSGDDVSTEWRISDITEVDINAVGIQEVKIQSFSKGSGYGGEKVEVRLYKFDSMDNAQNYYTADVNKVKEKRGYKEIKQTISNCFGYEQSSLTTEIQKSICYNKNIVFSVKAYAFVFGWGANYTNQFNTIIDSKIKTSD